MATFKQVAKNKLGYSLVEVDSFITIARDQFNQPNAKLVDWRDFSSARFSMEKGGYATEAVDAALDKLQDTFAQRELQGVAKNATALRNLLHGRIERSKKRRFAKVGFFSVGYSIRQVDAMLNLVGAALNGEAELSIPEVRAFQFKPVRGGYSESQVDAFVDRLVEVLHTQRFGFVSAPSVISTNDSGFGGQQSANPNPYHY